MDRTSLFKIGLVGSAVAAVCCFTPVLVFSLGVLGFGAWLGWIDFVLLPMLGIFLGLTIYALWLRHAKAPCPHGQPDRKEAMIENQLSGP